MEPNEKFVRYAVIALSTGILIVLGGIFYDAHQSADADGADVTRTIQQVKDESSTARTELNNARTELRNGQARADDAEKTTGRLQDSNEQSRAVIEDSQRLLGEIRDEFADIDRTNGITETQTGNQEPSE